jgi:phytoene synthase
MTISQRDIFDRVAFAGSRNITRSYSTSFSFGIRLLKKSMRDPICAIYGFVRYADEIVDTLHEFDKPSLLARFRKDTVDAVEMKISMNPVLHAFQLTFHRYGISFDLVDRFLVSMEMDLDQKAYDRRGYEDYILGSAEVVGLMCLRVFTEGDDASYELLKPYAMRLGAAFQKINFLRDLNADFEGLGRAYFPGLQVDRFDDYAKARIEKEIEEDFNVSLVGIQMLPKSSRLGVYTAYLYYRRLFDKIRSVPSERILDERIRIPNSEKIALAAGSYIRNSLNLL